MGIFFCKEKVKSGEKENLWDYDNKVGLIMKYK